MRVSQGNSNENMGDDNARRPRESCRCCAVSKPSLFLYLVGIGTVEVTLHIGDQNTLNGEQGAGELGDKSERKRGGSTRKARDSVWGWGR